MRKVEFQKILNRDANRCYHCGISSDTLIPQHRIGRGMGGVGKNSPALKPANIITFCSVANNALESNSEFAALGREMGWKLYSWQDPEFEPVYDVYTNQWYALDNDYGIATYLFEKTID